MWVDGTWTSRGWAGAAAEIAWRSDIERDGTWTSRGRAGAAEIAWEEAIGTEGRHRRG